MKNILQLIPLLFLLILAGEESDAQLPNNSFEEWETIDNYEKPLNWETNQDTETNRLEKSTESVDGNYSMKMIPDDSISGGSHACATVVRGHFSFDQPVQPGNSIFYYLKSEALQSSDTTFLRVKAEFYINGGTVKIDYQPFYNEINNYTLQQIPFPDNEIDSVDIEFFGAALTGSNGFGCRYLSNFWIDNIYVDATLATDFASANDLKIYPNPASGMVHIDSEGKRFERYKVFNMQGQLIDEGNYHNQSIELFSTGLNVIILIDNQGEVYRATVLNQ